MKATIIVIKLETVMTMKLMNNIITVIIIFIIIIITMISIRVIIIGKIITIKRVMIKSYSEYVNDNNMAHYYYCERICLNLLRMLQNITHFVFLSILKHFFVE